MDDTENATADEQQQQQADASQQADTDTDTGEKDWKAEADKWKTLARKHEDQSKSNAAKAKQFDEITEAQMSELEKANERAAQAETRAAEIEQRATRAEVAAATGVPAELLSGTTQEDLEASAAKLLEFRGTQQAPDFGAGNRGGDAGKPSQMSRDEVKRLYAAGKHAEIDKARKEGRLDGLFTRT